MKKKIKSSIVTRDSITIGKLKAKLDEATKLMNSQSDMINMRDEIISKMEIDIAKMQDHINELASENGRLQLENNNLRNLPNPVYPKPVGYSGSSNAKVYWKVGV